MSKGRAFFSDEKRRRALEWEASSWVGTPFHAHAKLKGVGVDCVQLAGRIYIATGFLREDQFNIGWYPIDGGHHDENSRVVEWIEKSGLFARATEPRTGDLLCIKFARVAHHVGVMISERQFVHAYFKHMVVMSNLDDPIYRKRIEAVYRPIVTSDAAVLEHVRD